MGAPQTPAEMHFSVDARQFSALLGRSSRVEQKLRAGLRTQIRQAGLSIVEQQKRRLGASTGPRHLRDQIAAGLKVTVTTAATGGGVSLRSIGPLAAAWQSEKGFRHKTFGHEPVVTQKGAPGYFWQPVHEKSPQIRRTIEQVMKEAVSDL